jgi:predicted DNA binding CopG/RHH family protein
MGVNELKLPKFSSEKEESDWWAANPDFALQVLQRAKVEGRLGNGSVARRQAAIDAAKRAVIELDAADIMLASRQAERKGLERQTYLKTLLHDALLKAEESQDHSSAA